MALRQIGSQRVLAVVRAWAESLAVEVANKSDEEAEWWHDRALETLRAAEGQPQNRSQQEEEVTPAVPEVYLQSATRGFPYWKERLEYLTKATRLNATGSLSIADKWLINTFVA